MGRKTNRSGGVGKAGDRGLYPQGQRRSAHTFQAFLGIGREPPMPQLVVQEADDGVCQALLVVHLETGRDDARGCQDLQSLVKHEDGAACTGALLLPTVLLQADICQCAPHPVRQDVNDPISQIRYQDNQAQSPCSWASGRALHPSKSLPLVLMRGRHGPGSPYPFTG